MSLVSVRDASVRLGVSVRQVQRYAAAGQITAVGPARVDLESVLRLEATRSAHRRRAWQGHTAWAAIASLSAVEATWLGQPQVSRLRTSLRSMTAEELVARTRNRAHVHLLQGHRAAVDRIAAEIVTTGSGEAVGDLATQTRATADGYVTSDVFDDLVSRYNLTEGTGTTSNVTLRVTSFDPETIRQIAAAGEVLAGLDLADSLDTRERAAGLQVLTAALGADR